MKKLSFLLSFVFLLSFSNSFAQILELKYEASVMVGVCNQVGIDSISVIKSKNFKIYDDGSFEETTTQDEGLDDELFVSVRFIRNTQMLSLGAKYIGEDQESLRSRTLFPIDSTAGSRFGECKAVGDYQLWVIGNTPTNN